MSAADARTPDALLGGRLRLLQDEAGHRAGTDAILLAALAPPGGGLAVDLGCGSGAVGLIAALAEPARRVLLVDNDESALALARRNVALNHLDDRVEVRRADALAAAGARRAAGLPDGAAALVLTNPPYGSSDRMRSSPDPARAAAHVMPPGGLAAWIRCAADMLAHRGALALIHRADALADLLEALRGRFGGVAVTPVHPRAGRPATRVLAVATKGGGAPLTIRPGLVLHEADGRFTPLAEALHRGEARLAA